MYMNRGTVLYVQYVPLHTALYVWITAIAVSRRVCKHKKAYVKRFRRTHRWRFFLPGPRAYALSCPGTGYACYMLRVRRHLRFFCASTWYVRRSRNTVGRVTIGLLSYVLMYEKECKRHLFSIPFICLRPSFLPPIRPTRYVDSRNSDPGSRSRLFSPLPAMVRALQFYREKISGLSCLIDSRRIVPTHATRSKQFILSFFCSQINAISPRRDSNFRTNSINSINNSIRG